ncbi:Do family serine endopeptidase [Mesorhizobium sp. Z1-4]|uniref:Do family serine endopeptidase n=1 Tax=Mesorhizobium sp. Z1-4 TaxID=2448478 RepID=UPI000FD7A4F7|nr:Do family serine endopeptidase [Mesorhizobium sp. Z1-4]
MLSSLLKGHLNRLIVPAAAAAFLAVAPVAHAQEAVRPYGPASVADLAEGLLSAVVNISTSQNVDGGRPNVPPPQVPEGSPFQDFFDDFFNDRGGPAPGPRRVNSLGSGFVVDADEGIIITNNHVIADADEIEVNFSDGATLKAELIGRDAEIDLAVLKVDPAAHKLTAVPFGDSDAIRIGDWVMAIGNPFGLGGSVTVGIVSARDRNINSGRYDDFIQTDAAINRGNSGGPLFNMNGEVIGINTAIISPSGGSIGIGFAIPSELAVGVIDQLRQFGETRRGWLGVRIQPVSADVAESLGLDRARGVLIAGVVKGGPVDDGSIQPGDVILKFNGRNVDEVRDLRRVVADTAVGSEAELVILRKGEEITVTVKLGRLEESVDVASSEHEGEGEAGELATASVLGMTIAELNDDTRAQFEISDGVNGVVIVEVAPNSAAGDKGIVAGDVITEIAQESVSTPQEVLDRIGALKGQGRRNALLMLSSRNGDLRFETVRMN